MHYNHKNRRNITTQQQATSQFDEEELEEEEEEEEQEEEEEELRHIFGRFGITVKWPWHGCMQLFLSRDAMHPPY